MNRIGADAKIDGGPSHFGSDPLQTLAAVNELGFEGILLRTLDGAFPDLDAGQIREFAQEAAARDMFVQPGLGKVNPYMTAELPRVRTLGQGSYLAGMERMIAACAEHGWTETWTATGGYKKYPGMFCFDRFRTDADWADQLAATTRFLQALAPVLRHYGVRLNLETHEEITSFEILRVIEVVGEDVVGVCLDPANLPVRGEVVQAAVERVAPYTHLTHLRDFVLVPVQQGIARFLMPVGQGVIDWGRLLGTLLATRPDLDLTIEGVGATRVEMLLQPQDPHWRAAHPDMTDADAATLVGLAADYPAQVIRGQLPPVEELRRHRPQLPALTDFLQDSAARLRTQLQHRLQSISER